MATKPPAAKRARRRAAPRPLLDDVEDAESADSGSGSGSDAEDPLDALLHGSLGYPLAEGSRAWSATALKLRRTSRAHYTGGETVVGGVYWVQAPDGRDGSAWAAEQPWMDSLTCQPHKNSLAPGAPKSFSVAYRHPSRRDWIGVPRFLGQSLFGTASRDVRSAGEPMGAAVALRAGRPLRDYQLRARAAALAELGHWGGATIIADCGAGKCLGYGTPILMFDGSEKAVQDVCVGDLLMGDDSGPRTVLSLARGREPLYRVVPTKGAPYTVNESHILSLKHSTSHGRARKGDIVDIGVRDYLALPPTCPAGGRLLGYRVGVTFVSRAVPIDPYMLGYWLGDPAGARIPTTDHDVVEYMRASAIGLASTGVPGSGCNAFMNALRDLDLLHNKHVPDLYRVNDDDVRLGVLAGIIDSGGHLSSNVFDITLVNERLIDGVIFLARSLGFAAYKSVCEKTCTNSCRGPVETYYRTCIHGAGLERIPTLLPRKRARARGQVKDALVTRIRLKPLGEGDYYGFSIDGNRRFLLGDFTVTHNTAMALSIASVLKRKTLVLCNRSFLMQQWRHDVEGKLWTWADDNAHVADQAAAPTLWRLRCDACKKVLVATEAERRDLCTTAGCGYRHVLPWIGTVAPREGWLDGVRVGWLQGALVDGATGKPSKTVDVADKDVVISSIDSVAQCGYPRDLLAQFGLIIVDEMHHLGALTLSQVLPQVPARYVLGISATPDRNDGLEHVLYWLAGPTCFVYKRLPSITGLSATVHVRQLLFRGGARKEVVYRSGQIGFAAMINSLAADAERNALLLALARDARARGRRKVLIVTSIVEHAKGLAAALGGPAAGVMTIFGGCSAAIVVQGKSDAARVVVATYQFLEEGYDDPTLDTLIMALPRSRIQQVVGRCERTHEGKLVPEVLDVVDTFSVFEPMSWKRHHFYKSRGFRIARTEATLASSAAPSSAAPSSAAPSSATASSAAAPGAAIGGAGGGAL